MLVHPAGRRLLPLALRFGISANAVSLAGLASGALAAICFAHWRQPALVLLGLVFAICWLILDGLDGMVARATKTASAFGRILDGLCDHGVFALIYVLLIFSLGGSGVTWLLAIAAGIAHAVQSSLYEGERARFHRRVKGDAAAVRHASLGSRAVRAYDAVAGSIDRIAAPFDAAMRGERDPGAFGRAYGSAAAPTMKVMSLLSANVRVITIALACLARDPALFWWAELGPLTLVAVFTLVRHRQIERALVAHHPSPLAKRVSAPDQFSR
ncbi:MAG: CDP-alcohol phosphatidyltransferase family protein [Sphingomonas sp.]